MKATGEFDVELKPLEAWADGDEHTALARLSMEKTYRGDLKASARGELLTARTKTTGAAGYVAVEYVSGSLGEKSGTFVLQHLGTSHEEKNVLILEVMPGSGTGDLAGVSGKMAIDIAEDKHFYTFEYEL